MSDNELFNIYGTKKWLEMQRGLQNKLLTEKDKAEIFSGWANSDEAKKYNSQIIYNQPLSRYQKFINWLKK